MNKNYMLSPLAEKKLLQIIYALACVIPIFAGVDGILNGVDSLNGSNISLDSHFRYLSGLLLGIGLGFLSTIPHIEHHDMRIRLLTLIVVTGGIARLIGIWFMGMPNPIMLVALGMELIITPILCLWQYHLAKRLNS